MPDENTQTTDTAPAAEVTTSVADAPSPESGADAQYDAAFEQYFGELAGGADADESQPQKTEAPAAEQATGLVLSDAEKSILARAQLNPEWFSGRSRSEIEATVAYLSKMQADADRMGAELGRLRPVQEKAPEQQQQQQAPSPFASKLDSTFEKLEQAYEGDIGLLKELFTELHSQASGYQGQATQVSMMSEFLTEMAVDSAIDSLVSKYPSINAPEARQLVTDRFWMEMNTGEYAGKGSFRSQIRAAAENAAKVVFSNVTEQSAAASLVTANRDRVAAQPRVGSPKARGAPRSADEVYDQAFETTIGKELAESMRR